MLGRFFLNVYFCCDQLLFERSLVDFEGEIIGDFELIVFFIVDFFLNGEI